MGDGGGSVSEGNVVLDSAHIAPVCEYPELWVEAWGFVLLLS